MPDVSVFPLHCHLAHCYSKSCWHFVTVIEVEQVMLYLSLVMDHIFMLFSNSLPGAEEPPCAVTLIS